MLWTGSKIALRKDFVLLGVAVTLSYCCTKVRGNFLWTVAGKLKSCVSVRELFRLYTSNLLAHIENWTTRFVNARETTLCTIDYIQNRFLYMFGVFEDAALLKFGLAPLSMKEAS